MRLHISISSFIVLVAILSFSSELIAAPKKVVKSPLKALVEHPVSDPINLFKEATFLLPQDTNISTNWILPPSDTNIMEGMIGIDPSKIPLIGYQASSHFYLLKPHKEYRVEVNVKILNMIYLENGVLLMASANSLGLLAEPKEKKIDEHGIPLVGFQPLISFPLKSIDVLYSFDNTPYCAGLNPKTKRYSLYALRSIKGAGLSDIELIYESDQPITAIAADKESIFVAVGRNLMQITRKDGTFRTLYTHPSETIIELAVLKDAIITGTNHEIIFVGRKGSMEIMRSSGHRMVMRQDTLYVFFMNSLGVLAINNLNDLSRFDLTVRPASSGNVSLPLSVSGVHFFESGPPPYNQKTFTNSFESANIRRIVAQIDMKTVNTSTKPQKHTLTISWYEPTGGQLLNVSYPVSLNPRASTKQILVSIGEESSIKGYIPRSKGKGGLIWKLGKDALGSRYPGKYHVSIQLDGVPQGEWFFSITGQSNFLNTIFYDDLPTLKMILSQKPSSEYKDENGNPFINLAVEYGSTEAVKLLLDMGANPNEMDKNGVIPLELCGMSKVADNIKKAELLIQRGANVNALTGLNKRPLIHEVYDTDYTIFLIKNGADINTKDTKYNKQTAAEKIINGNSIECSDELINTFVNHGFDLNAISQKYPYQSFLGTAIENTNYSCVSQLLNRGVSTSAVQRLTNEPERSALYLALKKLHSRITSEYGIKSSPEEIVTSRRIVQLLIDKGAKLKPGKKLLTSQYFDALENYGSSLNSDSFTRFNNESTSLRTGEGRMMFRGESPSFFSEPEMIDMLNTDDAALNEASNSINPILKNMALLTHIERVRELMASAKNSIYLSSAHDHCEEAFKISEANYPLKQLTLVADISSAAEGPKSNPFADITFITRTEGGVYVQKLSPDGAAFRSGLRIGDIVLAVNTQKIKDSNEVISILSQLASGMPAQITFRRDESMIMPELQLTCGILEKAMGKKGLAEMNLTRWISKNHDAQNSQEIIDLLNDSTYK